MAPVALDLPRIQKSKPKQLVVYFNELRQAGYTDIAICEGLFEALKAENSSYSVVAVFLSWSYDPEVIVLYLHHGPTRLGRRLAINMAGKLLADADSWQSIWTALGETQGLVDLFAAASVEEVRLLSLAISRCGRRRAPAKARQEAIESLIKALLPRSYPESPILSQDKRPIQHQYARMLPACSDEFINAILDAKDKANPLYLHLNRPRFEKRRDDLVRKRVNAAVEEDRPQANDDDLPIKTFLLRDMAFGLNTVRLRLEDKIKEVWPRTVTELEVVLHHLRRMTKKGARAKSEIHSMISLALEIIQSQGLALRNQHFRATVLWSIICFQWWKEPSVFEAQLVAGMRLGLVYSQHKIGQGYFISKDGREPLQTWNWTLLRLYCLHVPTDGIDLDTVTDYSSLPKLAWTTNLFFEISKKQAEKLLLGLYEANPDRNFLNPDVGSILFFEEVRSMAHKNFNVDLLLAILRRNNVDAAKNATKAVDKLRQKSSKAKEQADRAEIAKAASAYAIASGSLELYAETVVWQQRFVRDPLTVKAIFSGESITSKEGIALLSGIPDPLASGQTLEGIVTNIGKSDEILKSFEETMLLAKREPSFYQNDWRHVTSLPGLVFKERVARAVKVQQNEFNEKKIEVFKIIWENGIAMAEKLQNQLKCMDSLFMHFPADDLAKATKVMLDSGDARRTLQDRKPEDDILESMSYKALKTLASGGKPSLAKQLILQTVLGRPDASAWHRELLSIGFMKRLGAYDAQDMLLAFAKAIGEKLEEQSYVKVGEAKRQKSAPPQSIVKVTTIKYLAQLLDHAEFISADAAIEVLIELFRTGTHQDVRIATLDSLLSSLNDICNGREETWRANPLTEKIISALEVVIPIAGGINEQSPPREQDWSEAREKGTVLETSDVSSENPPLFAQIIAASNATAYPNLQKLREDFVSRLILPILAYSQKEHQRWVCLFLAKHKAGFEAAQVPPSPITPRIWSIILTQYAELVPTGVLEDYFRYLTISVTTPKSITDLNESLKADSTLRNAPDVKHWLQIYGPSKDDYHNSAVRKLLSIVDALYEKGQSFSRCMEMIFNMTTAMLDNYEKNMQAWTGLVSQFRPPLKNHAAAGQLITDHPRWTDARLPLLEKITEHLLDRKRKAARSPDKVRNLPSALELQIFQLPYPLRKDEAEKQRRVFAGELDDLLVACFQAEMNVLQWPKVVIATGEISTLFDDNKERIHLACHVARLRQAESATGARAQLLSALNLVKFKTAIRLIEDGWPAVEKNGKDRDEAIVKEKQAMNGRLKSVIELWQASDDESIQAELTAWRREKDKIWSQIVKG